MNTTQNTFTIFSQVPGRTNLTVLSSLLKFYNFSWAGRSVYPNGSIMQNGSSHDDEFNLAVLYRSTYSQLQTLILVCVFVLIVVWSALVNCVVIWAVYKKKQLHTITNYFISSLAVADLMVAVTIMPFAVALFITEEWMLGGLCCTLWTSGDILCCTASILLLTAIALDRHWAVSQPIDYRQKMTDRRCSVVIAFVWIFSTFLALAQILWRFIIESAKDRRTCTYTIDREFRIVSSMSSFFVPLAVLIFTYSNIINIALSSSAENKPFPAQNQSSSLNNLFSRQDTDTFRLSSTSLNLQTLSLPRKSKNFRPAKLLSSSPKRKSTSMTSFFSMKNEELKTAKIIGIVIICFVFCWLPFFTLYLLEAFCLSCEFPKEISLPFLWMGYAKSGVNPVIYFFFDKHHREAYREVIISLVTCAKKQSKYTISIRSIPSLTQKVEKKENPNPSTVIHNLITISDNESSDVSSADVSHRPKSVSPNAFSFSANHIREFQSDSQAASISTNKNQRFFFNTKTHFSPIAPENDQDLIVQTPNLLTVLRGSPIELKLPGCKVEPKFCGNHCRGSFIDLNSSDKAFKTATLITIGSPKKNQSCSSTISNNHTVESHV